MVTNLRIERKKGDIARTEIKLTEVRTRLREQKQDLINLENEEIVAMFRKEIITEDDLATLMRSRVEAEKELNDETKLNDNKREEILDVLDKN